MRTKTDLADRLADARAQLEAYFDRRGLTQPAVGVREGAVDAARAAARGEAGGQVGGGVGDVAGVAGPAPGVAAWADLSSLWGQMDAGAIHEWFAFDEAAPADGALGEAGGAGPESGAGSGAWLAPMSVLVSLAWQGVSRASALVAWVGRGCWPYPPALVRRGRPEGEAAVEGVGGAEGDFDDALLERSLFVDAVGLEERCWCVEVLLRGTGGSAAGGVGGGVGVGGVGGVVVIADAQGLTMPLSRRLALAAAAGRGGVGLLARPGWELGRLSAARTRWAVHPRVDQAGPGWTVRLLRRKGVRPVHEGARPWAVRRAHDTGDVGVVGAVVDRPVASELAASRRRA